MKKLFAVLLYTALPAAVAFGQTVSRSGAAAPVTNPLVDRVERMSKWFPAEFVVPAHGQARLSRSYCVYHTADNSVTMKPCEPKARKVRLAPAFQTGLPSKL